MQSEGDKQGKGGVFSGIRDQEGGSGRRADNWKFKEAESETHRRCNPSWGSLGWWDKAREVCQGHQGLKSGVSSARDQGGREAQRERERDGTSTPSPDTAAQPTGRGASPALPLPRDHPGWAWPRRPWCLHTSPSLGLPPPSPPPPPYRRRGSEPRAPSVPQNLLQVYSCASRPSSTQLPRARKARARPGHSRSGYIRSRGGGPLPGLKGGAAPATRWVPRAAPAADGWRCSAPCPARLYPHPPTPPVSGTHRMESAELAFPSSPCTPCPLVPLTSL